MTMQSEPLRVLEPFVSWTADVSSKAPYSAVLKRDTGAIVLGLGFFFFFHFTTVWFLCLYWWQTGFLEKPVPSPVFSAELS